MTDDGRRGVAGQTDDTVEGAHRGLTERIPPFVRDLDNDRASLWTLVAASLALSRYSPRVLIAGGLAAVGIGDLAFALVRPDTPYLYFVMPFVAIGAGFVIGTTVRTAVIFASVPRRLPATAAALNETSLLIGGQIGIVVVTALVGEVAIQTFTEGTAGMSAQDASAAVGAFSDFLKAIGTSAFGPLIADLPAGAGAQYGEAYAAGVSASLTAVGAVAVIASIVAWMGMGPQARVTSVWDLRDERAAVPLEPGEQPGGALVATSAVGVAGDPAPR
jgi:hypothetical protein